MTVSQLHQRAANRERSCTKSWSTFCQ